MNRFPKTINDLEEAGMFDDADEERRIDALVDRDERIAQLEREAAEARKKAAEKLKRSMKKK